MDVSVIVPCRNEEAYIERCVRSIEESRPPGTRMEVLIVDGMSDDGTRPAVERLAAEYGNIRLLDNPRRRTPAALNIGLRQARGRYVMRMDAHAEVGEGYVARCRRAIEEHGVDNVGGLMRTVPQGRGPTARAVAACLSHRFGVGNSPFRTGATRPGLVDTVFGGFYRREVFDRIGPFNEKLARGQDIEFNLRLKEAGGRTMLVPEIVSTYYARSDFGSFLRHNFSNGEWVVLAFAHSRVRPVTARHLVPLAFVSSLILCLALSWWEPARACGAAALAAYALAAGAAAAQVAWRERDPRLLPLVAACFAGLHIGYGLGSLWGAARLAGERIGGWFRKA
jgi:glycosyltransferase involved in cell wall biosynthesis